MIPVKTMPRFKCDFCKKRGVRAAMEKHERRCYRNPNRFCDGCQNTGKMKFEEYQGDYEVWVEGDCTYCAKFNQQMKDEIEAYELSIAPEKTPENTPAPF